MKWEWEENREMSRVWGTSWMDTSGKVFLPARRKTRMRTKGRGREEKNGEESQGQGGSSQ